jgi:hypothetical protein
VPREALHISREGAKKKEGREGVRAVQPLPFFASSREILF